MPAHELYGWMERLKLRRRDQDVVAAAVTLAPAIAQRLSGAAAAAPSEMHELLAGQALEVLVLAAASVDSPEVEERLRAYLERVRDVRLEISGDDLRRAGVPESPAIGEALRRTLALKLDGFVSGRDEELRTALRLLGRQ
jgi:tRNA nucleotidyltransferase (CCA-adding enzyme)